jgi:gas vesicle protein
MSKKNKGGLGKFLLGAGIGAGLAMLLTKKTGKENREQLKQDLQEQIAEEHKAMKEEADAKHAEIEQVIADFKAESEAKHVEMEEEAKAKHEEMKAEADAEHKAVRELIDIQKPFMADLAAYPTSKFLFACGNPITVEPNKGQKYDAEKPEDAVAFVYRWAEGFEAIVVEKEEAAKVYLVGGHGHDKVKVKRPIPQTNILVRDVKIKGIVGGSYFEGMVGHANIEAENCEFVSIMGAGWCGASVDGDVTRMNIVDDINMKLTNCKVSSTLFGGAQGNGVADDVHMELNNCQIGWLTAGGANGMTRNAEVVMNGGTVTVAQSTNRGVVHKAKLILNDGVINSLYFGGETEDTTVDGIIEDARVELNGGIVKSFNPGTNNGVEIVAEDIKGSIRECVVNDGDVSMLEQSKHMFFGGDDKNVPCANMDEVRALEGKVRVDVKEVKFVVPVGSQRVVVAVPVEEEVEEIQYMGQGCVDYKDMFEEEVVEGHRVMTYIFAVPCSAKMTFKVILK